MNTQRCDYIDERSDDCVSVPALSEELASALPDIQSDIVAASKDSEKFSRLLEAVLTIDVVGDSRSIQFIGMHDRKASSLARQFALYASSHYPAPVCFVDMASTEGLSGLVINSDQDSSTAVTKQLSVSDSEQIYRLSDTSLYMSSGGISPSSTKLGESSKHFEAFKKRAEGQYPLMIVDAPPLSHSIEGVLLSSRVDGVVLVLEAERSRRRQVRDVSKRVANAGGRVIGAVLTERKRYLPSFLSYWLD